MKYKKYLTFCLDISIDQYGPTTLKILGGVATVAAAIPTGGTSLTAFGALSVGATVVSGTYAAGSGAAELALKLKGEDEKANDIPAGYLNATVGIVITNVVDDQETSEVVNATLTLVEGFATFNFKSETALKKIDNALNISNIIISNVTTGESENQSGLQQTTISNCGETCQ